MIKHAALVVVLASVPTATLLVPPAASAAGSRDSGAEFDAFEQALESDYQQLDAALEADFLALDKALEAGFQRLHREVAAAWGEGEVELPSKHKWVDYSEDINTRRVIDFEKGTVTLERLVDEGSSEADVVASLNAAAEAVTSDTLSDLSEKDLALKYAKEQLERDQIDFDPYVAANGGAVVGSLVNNVTSGGRLGKTVSEAMAKGQVNEDGIRAGVSQLTNGKKKVGVEIPFNFGFQSTLASRYRSTVVRQARAHNVSPSLLYAVMETESSFNPRARSPIPAFGLMQLVPRSGGMDAYNHVYGEKVLLDPEYLYDPARNVELGAAYLNLVYTRYLRHIKNPQSRLYCTIAAYNTGAGNVARTFAGTNSVPEAAKVINTMTPAEVYEYMRQNLPYEETRNYLEKVTRAQKKFSSLDHTAGVSSDAI